MLVNYEYKRKKHRTSRIKNHRKTSLLVGCGGCCVCTTTTITTLTLVSHSYAAVLEAQSYYSTSSRSTSSTSASGGSNSSSEKRSSIFRSSGKFIDGSEHNVSSANNDQNYNADIIIDHYQPDNPMFDGETHHHPVFHEPGHDDGIGRFACPFDSSLHCYDSLS